jgi:spermidine/putrescine transport system permease protein
MTSRAVFRLMFGFYSLIFFGFLFGPLILMGVTAFNTPTYPQAYPFESFTTHWFADLISDTDLMDGLVNSLIIGAGVVLLAVPVGLAGAIVMTQVYWRARGLYYLIVVSPVLTPGVILGISTVIFWKDVTRVADAKFLYDGFFLTILGQSTFIAAYCMLVFLARLQRFDTAQEDAARDLGATQFQVFRDILLPFLRPAVLSASVLAFLSSFENYNTTTFAILSDKTMVTVLAGRVRQGTTPAISALAVLIIAVTLAGAVIYEILRRREAAREARAAAAASDDLLERLEAPAPGRA